MFEDLLSQMIQQRDRLTGAINALQQGNGQLGSFKRRGRPPGSAKKMAPELLTMPKKRVISAAGRRKMAIAQKKRWDAIRAAQK